MLLCSVETQLKQRLTDFYHVKCCTNVQNSENTFLIMINIYIQLTI